MLLYVNTHRKSKNYEAFHSDDHTPNFVVFLSLSPFSLAIELVSFILFWWNFTSRLWMICFANELS